MATYKTSFSIAESGSEPVMVTLPTDKYAYDKLPSKVKLVAEELAQLGYKYLWVRLDGRLMVSKKREAFRYNKSPDSQKTVSLGYSKYDLGETQTLLGSLNLRSVSSKEGGLTLEELGRSFQRKHGVYIIELVAINLDLILPSDAIARLREAKNSGIVLAGNAERLSNPKAPIRDESYEQLLGIKKYFDTNELLIEEVIKEFPRMTKTQ